MPRTIVRRKKLPNPVAVIDLTQDSPSNATLRLSRSCTDSGTSNIRAICRPELLEDCDMEVTLENDVENIRNQRPLNNRRRLNSQPTVVINLEETINVECSPSKETKVQRTPILPESPKTKALSCPICMENLADDKIKAMTTPCGHVFCYDCLKVVTASKKKCSLCQRAITFSKCIRLHI